MFVLLFCALNKCWKTAFVQQRRQAAASRLPDMYSVNDVYEGHADIGQLLVTSHSCVSLTVSGAAVIDSGHNTQDISFLDNKHVGM